MADVGVESVERRRQEREDDADGSVTLVEVRPRVEWLVAERSSHSSVAFDPKLAGISFSCVRLVKHWFFPRRFFGGSSGEPRR